MSNAVWYYAWKHAGWYVQNHKTAMAYTQNEMHPLSCYTTFLTLPYSKVRYYLQILYTQWRQASFIYNYLLTSHPRLFDFNCWSVVRYVVSGGSPILWLDRKFPLVLARVTWHHAHVTGNLLRCKPTASSVTVRGSCKKQRCSWRSEKNRKKRKYLDSYQAGN